MKQLRIFFILSMTICVCLMFFYFLGNPFDALLTQKSAKRQNSIMYSGKMAVSGVVFDRENNRYVAKFDDGNGVVSEYVYDPDTNSFTDNYREDQISVIRHTIRGEVIKKITSYGVVPGEVLVEFECDAGLIGQNTRTKLYKVYVKLESPGKDEFINDVVIVLKALAETDFESYEITNGSFTGTFTRGNISNKVSDIAARIRENE